MPKATSKGSDLPLIPTGIHQAVCYAVIDLGTQPSQMFAPSRKVMLVWELPHERADFMEDGKTVNKPRVISAEYTLSTGKKSNLRRDLESWRGRPFTTEEAASFEVGVLAGHNCQLNIIHKPSADGSKTYARVNSIVPIGKTTPRLKPESPILVYDLPNEGPITFPKDIPEWIQNKIKASEEYEYSVNPHKRRQEPTEDQMANVSSDPIDENIPF